MSVDTTRARSLNSRERKSAMFTPLATTNEYSNKPIDTWRRDMPCPLRRCLTQKYNILSILRLRLCRYVAVCRAKFVSGLTPCSSAYRIATARTINGDVLITEQQAWCTLYLRRRHRCGCASRGWTEPWWCVFPAAAAVQDATVTVYVILFASSRLLPHRENPYQKYWGQNWDTVQISSSSSCSMPLQERRCFHDFTPLIPVVSSVPGRPQPQILLFEVVLDST